MRTEKRTVFLSGPSMSSGPIGQVLLISPAHREQNVRALLPSLHRYERRSSPSLVKINLWNPTTGRVLSILFTGRFLYFSLRSLHASHATDSLIAQQKASRKNGPPRGIRYHWFFSLITILRHYCIISFLFCSKVTKKCIENHQKAITGAFLCKKKF